LINISVNVTELAKGYFSYVVPGKMLQVTLKDVIRKHNNWQFNNYIAQSIKQYMNKDNQSNVIITQINKKGQPPTYNSNVSLLN